MGTLVNGTPVGGAAGASAATASAEDATAYTRGTTSYAATSTPCETSIEVGASGVLVILYSGSCYEAAAGDSILMSVALSGSNTLAAADAHCAYAASPGNGLGVNVARALRLAGLVAGPTTVTLKWRTLGATWTIQQQSLVVIAP